MGWTARVRLDRAVDDRHRSGGRRSRRCPRPSPRAGARSRDRLPRGLRREASAHAPPGRGWELGRSLSLLRTRNWLVGLGDGGAPDPVADLTSYTHEVESDFGLQTAVRAARGLPDSPPRWDLAPAAGGSHATGWGKLSPPGHVPPSDGRTPFAISGTTAATPANRPRWPRGHDTPALCAADEIPRFPLPRR